MSRSIQFKNHPYRFLLYVEWILLAIAALSEVSPYPFPRIPRLPLVTFLSILAFGLTGLSMPTRNQIHKILYTFWEILLISLTTFAGGMRLFAFPYIVLVIRSCLIFQLPGRLVVTSLSFSLFLLTLFRWFQNFPARPVLQNRLRFFLLSYALLFGLSLAFVLLLMNALLAERQSREKLVSANEQLRQYALRIEDQATLQERNRIARDIHDSLGHSLTALNLQLETALKLWSVDPAKATKFLVQAKKLGSTALQDVRQSVSAMRSNPLQGNSFEDAIASLTEEFHSSTGISPAFIMLLGRPLPTEVTTAVYRIVQEALTNISKYSQATQVKIRLQAMPTELQVIVQDNGKGFNLDENTTGFGLHSMRDRTVALGGQFKINSAPDAGCCITATIPLPSVLE